MPDTAVPNTGDDEASTLSVSTYNVTAELPQSSSQRRYPLLVKSVLADDARSDILVLHEVTDDLLAYLLGQRTIQEAFPFSSHGLPDQQAANSSNGHCYSLVLSKYAFHSEEMSSLPEHNAFFVAKFSGLGEDADDHESTASGTEPSTKPLTLVVIQSSSFRGGEDRGVKNIEAIIESLDAINPTIVAASFGSHTSIDRMAADRLLAVEDIFDGFLDTWTFHRLEKGLPQNVDVDSVPENELGATYDPSTNPLAAVEVSTNLNVRAQRLDRILVRGNNSTAFQVLDFNIFGFPAEAAEESGSLALCAASHWGIRASLRLGPDPYGRPSSGTGDINERLQKAPTSLNDLAGFIEASRTLTPSEQEIARRATVHHLVEDFICGLLPSGALTDGARQSTPLGGIVPVGSYGLGTWTASSNMDFLCVGTISANTFNSLVKEQLQTADDHGITLHKSGDKDRLRLYAHGIRVELHYARADNLAANWPQCLKLPRSHEVWSLSKETRSRLRFLLDVDYVKRSVPDMAKFRLAHRIIRRWAESRGIYGYEYLSSMQITILLVRIYKAWAVKLAALSVPNVLVTFFRYYAKFDWTKNAVSDSFFHQGKPFEVGNKGGATIIGYCTQDLRHLNTAANTNPSSLRTLVEEFKRADRFLSEPHMTWNRFFKDDGAMDFLRSYKTYVKIAINFWGSSAANGKRYVVSTGDVISGLLRDLQMLLPTLHIRRWPSRWVNTARQAPVQEDTDDYYHGHYVMGIYQPTDEISRQEEKEIRVILSTILDRFQNQICRGENFDSQSFYFNIGIVKAPEVQALVVDPRDWSMFLLEEGDSDDETDKRSRLSSARSGQAEGPSKKKEKPSTNQPRSVIVPKPEGAGKFRTAADVLNRLRWDPKMDSADFIVGYEDRFVGAMEKGVDEWKPELTHEEFIPQHRILYFKRKSDGMVVWERRTRTDLVFESG